MKKSQKHNKKTAIIATISVVLTAAIGVGTYFGAKTIYDKGVSDGKAELESQISENVTTLAAAVSEKTNVRQAIIDTLSDIPTESNTESIAAYIQKLTELLEKITNPEVNKILANYKSAWENFQQIYATEDNAAITESFNDLRATTTETSTKIKDTLDQAIKNALDSLQNQ